MNFLSKNIISILFLVFLCLGINYPIANCHQKYWQTREVATTHILDVLEVDQGHILQEGLSNDCFEVLTR